MKQFQMFFALAIVFLAALATPLSASTELDRKQQPCSNKFITIRELRSGLIINTPLHGLIKITDPLLITLIQHPVIQRLKKIHQYGPSHFLKKDLLYGGKHYDDYTRYDHSISILLLYVIKNRPLSEQILALFHDASHGVFSHVVDFVFKSIEGKNYQDSVLSDFLEEHRIMDILREYNSDPNTTEQIPLDMFTQKPALDSIDYTITGAYFAGIISLSTAQELIAGLSYDKINNVWYFATESSAQLYAHAALEFSVINTGAAWNVFVYHNTAQAIKRAFTIELITKEEIKFDARDNEIWDRLLESKDPEIVGYMDNVLFNGQRCIPADGINTGKNTYTLKPKPRLADPVVKSGTEYVKLSAYSEEFKNLYQVVEKKLTDGWMVYLSKSVFNPFKKNIIYGV